MSNQVQQKVRTITVMACPCCGLTVKSYKGDQGWTCVFCKVEMGPYVSPFTINVPCQHGLSEGGGMPGGVPYPIGGKVQ